jgi:hypothetical protein
MPTLPPGSSLPVYPDPYANSSAPNPIYIGDCTWKEIAGADIAKNEFEIDVLTRPFMGPKSAFDSWIRNFPKYSQDYQYPTMARTVYRTKGLDAGMMECHLEYKGLIDGVPPTILPVTDVVLKSCQLTTDNAADGNIEVQYYAPTTTYRYVLAAANSGPLFGSPLYTSLDITPFSPRPPDYTGVIKYNTPDTCEGFKREQQGLWFTYEEVWTTLVQPEYALVEIPA